MCKWRFGWAHINHACKYVCSVLCTSTQKVAVEEVVLCLSFKEGAIGPSLPGFSFKIAMPKLIPVVLCSCRDCRQVLFCAFRKKSQHRIQCGDGLFHFPLVCRRSLALPFCGVAGDTANLEAFGCFHPGLGALLNVKLQPRCAAHSFSSAACICAAGLLEELRAAPQ